MKSLFAVPLFVMAPLFSLAVGGIAPALAESYPPEAVESFITDCTQKFQQKAPPGFSNRGTSFCTCMIQGIQDQMSFAEFQQLGDAPDNSTLQPIERACMAKMFSFKQ
ncbi:hypothetical protein L3556_00770 [Candidatus Synechococcus calcipolaris G9]|uniref:Uncharacterized protein n=1 Tax=Candidatus Synechococcus calcipolaris G9 TaxID=1497997 RepID=A0ABT6EUA9_9SYNE|nr:hypothetical protein [Candidatus Synechococcus calcipolaris]MDG2989470.1 hypothetical protein [Candidatus Synechococcus calcipolaris G9]